MNKFILSATFFFFSLNAISQTPHLAGEISVSVKKGIINCDFTLSNIPAMDDYTIMLNAGFNIAAIADGANKLKYRYTKVYNEKSDEAFQYHILTKPSTGKSLPRALRFTYTGAFPVLEDTADMYELGDWKGNIAFNGTSLRMTEQSAWYPILYNLKNDIIFNKYSYSIKVNCDDGSAIYLNGDAPKTGSKNTFRSSSPRALLLFAGNFQFNEQQGVSFINTGLSLPERTLLSKWTNNIIDFYSNKIGIPYGSKISYLAATPVTKDNVWLFVTYPTIAMVGRKMTMHDLFNKSGELSVDTSNITYIAHELGHYYFGTLLSPNSELQWVFLEGFTEFLSLQFFKEKLGKDVYKTTILKYMKAVEEAKGLAALNQLKQSKQSTEEYKYRYVPLLLTALEKQVGNEKIWKFISTVASSKNVTTDYSFFKSAVISTGVSDETYATFEERFINSDKRIENLLAELKD